uniref:polysaccharide pyruvyl transferase family protein n=1 Tax=Candidatus Stercorousia sp. TaxID=3048886 RepID=UPI004029AFC5
TIGVQLREFKTMNYNLLHKLALFIADKFSDKKVEIFSLQESQDLDLCKRFEHILITLNPEIKTEIVTDDIVNRISQLSYLIAMRFHAILVALKCGVKTCAINYDVKVEKLAHDAAIPLISMNANENFEDIYRKLENLNQEDLLRFSKTKIFDWAKFDELLLK